MPEGPALLRPRDAARRLNVDTETLRKWADKGAVGSITLPSGHRRYVAADIDALAASSPSPETAA